MVHKDVKQKAKYKNSEVEREVVRIVGRDLRGDLSIVRALSSIKGIGQRTALVLANSFFEKSKLPRDIKLGNIPVDKDDVLKSILENIVLPKWMNNRKKDVYSGKDLHLIGSDLLFANREDRQRLGRIKSRRGIRLQLGLRVRGQKTKSNFRRKQGVVGVMKKSSKAKKGGK